MSISDNHKRVLFSKFKSVEKQLDQLERLLSKATGLIITEI